MILNVKKAILLFLTMLPVALLGQNTISGVISERASGGPLPGVNVVEKGTTNGTVSDFDGNFEITVSELPATLVFSSLGYAAQELNVTDSASDFNIVMEDAATGLDEVVVTGLATSINRANSANAIASISAEALTGTTPPSTLDGAFYGKFAGAVVSQNSGAPGGGLSVRLRGGTSITGSSQPLYIMDGIYLDNSSIPGGLNVVSAAAAGGSASNQDNPTNRIADLNPDDIESIEVLKGASASAIYGARAAGGVVLITTKRGKVGKPKFSFSQSVGSNSAINLLGVRNFTEETVRASFGDAAVADFLAAQSEGRLINYESELYGGNGFLSNTNLNISGGSDKIRYYAGISHNDEEGIVQNTGYQRTSLRVNLNVDPTDYIKLDFSSNYVFSSSDRGFFNNDNSGTTIGVALTGLVPWLQLFPDENGVFPDNPLGSSNPLQTRELVTNNEQVDRLFFGGKASFRLYQNQKSDLELIFNGGLDVYSFNTLALFPKELQFQNPANGGLNGVSVQGRNTNKNYNLSAFLVSNIYTDNDINFRTQLGITSLFFDQNRFLTTATTLVASESNVDQAANIGVDQTRIRQEDSGFFVQEEVNIQDKLILTAGLRGDRSSNNGDSDRIFLYPKGSVAANLHNFGVGGDGSVLSQLKLRASYGEAGNFPVANAQFTSFNNFSTQGLLGISLGGVRGDGDILPERQREFEAGIDFGFVNNKFRGSLTFYNKTVQDLILQPSLEPSTGFNSQFVNAGSLRNRGVEIGFDANPFDTEDFQWSTGFNFFLNRSQVTELNVEPFNVGAFGATLGTFRIEEGSSATQLVGIGPNPGANGFQQFGDTEPDFQIAFDNNFRYKNWTLNFLWQWKQGGDNVNLTALLTDLNGTSADFDDIDLDPAGQLGNGNFRLSNLGVSASPFVEDASYVRLREAGLYYTLPETFLTSLFDGNVERIRFGFSGTNLINIFDYNSYDPEVSNFGANGLFTGIEVTPFPSSQRYLFHINVNF